MLKWLIVAFIVAGFLYWVNVYLPESTVATYGPVECGDNQVRIDDTHCRTLPFDTPPPPPGGIAECPSEKWIPDDTGKCMKVVDNGNEGKYWTRYNASLNNGIVDTDGIPD